MVTKYESHPVTHSQTTYAYPTIMTAPMWRRETRGAFLSPENGTRFFANKTHPDFSVHAIQHDHVITDQLRCL